MFCVSSKFSTLSPRLLRLFVVFLTAFFAFYQANHAFAIDSLKKNNLPVVLKAKQVNGDQVNQELEAKGNVEISKGTSKLFADSVIYRKKSKKFSASGNLKAKDLEVGYLTASSGEISDDLSSGEFFDSKIFFNDGSYLFSDRIQRNSPSLTILEEPSFSICPNQKIVDDDSKAGKIRNFATLTSTKSTIDRESGNIKSRNSVFKIYNVPVFYTPYSRIAIAGKKRQTGFLNPGYTRNNNFGLAIKTPLFIDISPSKDLTITPTYFFQNQQTLLSNQFRHGTKYGEYFANLELANNRTAKAKNFAGIGTSKKELRWNLKSEGSFDFTRDHGFDFKINDMSDRNYLKNYNFTGLSRFVPYTVSGAEFDYKHGRNYYFLNATKIQELDNKNTEKQEQIVLPAAEYHFETKPFFSKERISLTSNFTNIYRVSGLGYQRASLVPAVKLPFNFGGNLFEIDGRMQSDFYTLQRVNSGNGIAQNSGNYNSFLTNKKTEASLNWRLPMIKKTSFETTTIEPMANFVVSDFSQTNFLTPNEDSNSSELTVGNLFVTNRISGYDRIEAGQRFNYGFKSAYFHKFGQFSLTFGQSYRIKNKVQDVAIRGFANNNRSNYVGQATYKAKKYFSLTYSFQLDQSSFRNDINQLNSNFEYKFFTFNTDYLLIRRNLQVQQRREQLNFSTGFILPDSWKITLNSTIDLNTNRQLQRGITFERFGCCTNFSFLISESKPGVLSKPVRTFDLKYSFKNL